MRNVVAFMVVLSCAVPAVSQGAQPGPVPQASVSTPISTSQRNRAARQAARAQAFASVSPSMPVVSLDGVCERSAGNAGKACKTVVTKGQLDSMMEGTSPEATPAAQRQFAVRYARVLAASAAAERQHLERDPEVAKAIQEQMKQARKQVLAAAFYRKLAEQAARVPASATQKYYNEHLADFEEAQLLRVSIPKSAATEGGQQIDAENLKSQADEVRTHALAGDDFQKLQESAYKELGINARLPETKLSPRRRKDLSQDERKVLDLKPGDVSDIMDLPDSYVIFKLESKRTLTLPFVQNEINAILQTERLRQELQDTEKTIKADFNLKYLETPTAPELFPMPGSVQSMGRTWARTDARSRMMSGTQRWPSLQRRGPVAGLGPN